MKIKDIKIKNFRCYYGQKQLQFSLDGKITFIYGSSGAGKTSFIDFINWMFYNKRDFADEGKIDTHEIYNDRAAKETPYGKTFDVQGIIEFEHNDNDYQLIKTLTFEKTLSGIDELYSENELILNYYLDGSWVEYKGNIENKINEIIPLSLSKYFFFHGERTQLLTIDTKGSSSIKESVYKLFGLTEYESAIRHLGSNRTAQTLIHQYYSEMTRKISKLSTSDPQVLFGKITGFEANRREHEVRVNIAKKRREEAEVKKANKIKEIGKAQSSTIFEETIKANEKLIKELENNILDYKKKIGNCFYKSIPYLVLSDLTRKSVLCLSQEAKDNDKKYIVFKNLKKELLKEIMIKKQCVCGKELDEEMTKHIQSTIDSMPPDSYIFQLKQFGAIATEYIETSSDEYSTFDKLIKKIVEFKNEIIALNDKNQNLKEELKKSSDTKKLSDELNEIEKEIKKFLQIETENLSRIKDYDRAIAKYEAEYQNALHAANVKTEYEYKIQILEEVKSKMEKMLKIKNDETLKILEESILDIYKQISTRQEDFTHKKFLKDDFTFRNDRLAGGQEIVDVYSYIIGMIKALHVVDTNSYKKDFPMIIDAPFSHSDEVQSVNIFNVLPTIVPQVIMLTFDKTKIEDSLSSDKVGYCYMLKSDITQTETDIVAVDIDFLKKYKEVKKNDN